MYKNDVDRLCARGSMVDKGVIHSIETVVIEWSHQIREVLKRDSSESLQEGKHPTPHEELLFWKNRYESIVLSVSPKDFILQMPSTNSYPMDFG